MRTAITVVAINAKKTDVPKMYANLPRSERQSTAVLTVLYAGLESSMLT